MKRFVMMVAMIALVVPAAMAGDGDEWEAIEGDYEWLQTLRNANPVPPPPASRKDRIESWLASERKLEPVYGRFIERLEVYYETTGDPRAAALFAAEKIRMGDAYMNLLSRYDRAISMYRAALEIEPGNEDAGTKLSLAQKRQFVDPALFEQIVSGMRESEVEQILGLPREDWIRQKIEPGHVYSVWIYPRNDGGAAAVYFNGGVVYHLNWDASPAPKPVEEKAGGR
jgi:tetratricopeptide (TPR) repeat protein